MDCKLDREDCTTIEDAIFKLGAYAVDTKRNIEENITDYETEDILVKIVTDRINEISEISNNLSKIAKKCGCKTIWS